MRTVTAHQRDKVDPNTKRTHFLYCQDRSVIWLNFDNPFAYIPQEFKLISVLCQWRERPLGNFFKLGLSHQNPLNRCIKINAHMER